MNRSATGGRQRALSQHGPAAGHGHSRTGDITAFARSQQYVHRCEFGGLARSAKGCVVTEIRDLLLGHGSRYQRSTDRPGCDAVHSNTLLPQQLRHAGRKFAMAALVAAYGASVGEGISEFTDELPITDDPGPICGKAALTR
jgi:hypothetical protein